MRTNYKVYDKEAPYFITSTIVNWIPIFNSEKYYNILIDAIRYSQIEKNLIVYSYVLLDNHFHMIASSKELSNVIKSIKGYSAKKIISYLYDDGKYNILDDFKINKLPHKINSEYQIWQEGFHPQQILSDDMFRQKTDYIHLNPVRRNTVNEPEDWKYSSAEFYYRGIEGPIKLNGLE